MSTSVVIADTSAFVSLASIADSNHRKAVQISSFIEKSRRALVVPGEIVTETINVLGKKISHTVAVEVGKRILLSETFIVADTTEKIRKRAFEKFKEQSYGVSFTDCLVMTFADEYKTKEIFGFDEIFHKNGYSRLKVDEENMTF